MTPHIAPPQASATSEPQPPDAALVTSPAELTAALRQLKCWSGLSYRDLENRARRAGAVLPRSTLTTALSRDSLPREELVAAFVRACGCDQDETARWVAARRRLALAAAARQPSPADQPSPNGHPGHGRILRGRREPRPTARSLAIQLLPPAWHRAGIPTRALILVSLAAILVSTALIARAA